MSTAMAGPLQTVRDRGAVRVNRTRPAGVNQYEPVVTVTGDGELTKRGSRDRLIPGAFGITLRLDRARRQLIRSRL